MCIDKNLLLNIWERYDCGVSCCRGIQGASQLLVLMNLQNQELSGAELQKAASVGSCQKQVQMNPRTRSCLEQNLQKAASVESCQKQVQMNPRTLSFSGAELLKTAASVGSCQKLIKIESGIWIADFRVSIKSPF